MCVCVVSVKRQCEEKEQKLAVLEENLSSTQKEVAELRSCLREVERSRLEARRELQELRRQVRDAVTSPSHLCDTESRSWGMTSLLTSARHTLIIKSFSLAPAEGPGWREGAEGEGGGRAADSPVAGGAKGGGERKRAFPPQTEAH